MTGGDLIAEVLVKRGVKFVFTLCGGHISPILVSARERGIRVIDVRDEASAAFAADAVSRLTGTPGVAVVTAGPGLTNILTAVKNAQLAQSPLVVLGGATATLLKDRGALQDIDQLALFEPHVKWLATVDRVRDLVPAVEEAFDEARLGVAGPVFVECPVDLLYEESVVRRLLGVGEDAPEPKGPSESLVRWHLKRHLKRLFARSDTVKLTEPHHVPPVEADEATLRRVAAELATAERPVALVGSQALLGATEVEALAVSLDELGIPVYLSGMARGLLGCTHPRLFRHQRRQALREADLVILAGMPCDFRLDYGRHISRRTRLISVNLSDHELTMNRRPDRAIVAHPGFFLRSLAGATAAGAGERRQSWIDALRRRDAEREDDIAECARQETEYVNPIHLCREIDGLLGDDSVVVADGGDFVATASYTVRPRGPLRWLDPGVFGSLGVGGGFAMAAKLVRPPAEVWLLYGDGSAAYSLAELDTCVRHGLPVIAVVGNDGGWTQVAREQVEILGDDCGTVLRRSDYHLVAEGYGGRGLLLERTEEVPRVLAQAREIARGGTPVLVNALIGKTDFRKGSISI
ncbi:MAG: thiamine pyrophosphate-binding protein [bacterium]|nr:thiamine pyrophosphate-binding protein [bacterium]